jgi:hypothetical protein
VVEQRVRELARAVLAVRPRSLLPHPVEHVACAAAVCGSRGQIKK